MKSVVPATMIKSRFGALSVGNRAKADRGDNAERHRQCRQLTEAGAGQQISGNHSQAPTKGKGGDHGCCHDDP